MTDIIWPASRAEWLELRHPTIGASESPAMLGVHPMVTPFELWSRKAGVIVDRDNRFMRRGRLLEPIGIELLREERPDWNVEPNQIPGGKFYRDIEAGLSCTPDAFVETPTSDGYGILQIKTVKSAIFQAEWMVDGEIQIPPYVAIQAMQEAYLTNSKWACVGAIVGFDLDFHLIDVEIHAGVIDRLKREAPEFLRRVRDNDPPDPDYGRDGEALSALYADDDGGVVDLSGNGRVIDLVRRREQCKDIEGNGAEAAKQRKVIDAELIHMLGNATRGTLDGLVIEAKTIRKRGFNVAPTSFRSIKIKSHKANVV